MIELKRNAYRFRAQTDDNPHIGLIIENYGKESAIFDGVIIPSYVWAEMKKSIVEQKELETVVMPSDRYYKMVSELL